MNSKKALKGFIFLVLINSFILTYPNTTSASGFDKSIVSPSPCATKSSLTTPKLRQWFDYKSPDRPRDRFWIAEAITGEKNGQIRYNIQIVSADGRNAPKQFPRPSTMDSASWMGIIVGAPGSVMSGPNGSQFRLTFPGFSGEKITTLKPNSSYSFNVIQQIHTGSASKTGKHVWRMTFLGCGTTTSLVSGAPNEPVRAYKLEATGLQPNQDGKTFTTQKIKSIYYVSPRLGWRVAYRENQDWLILARIRKA